MTWFTHLVLPGMIVSWPVFVTGLWWQTVHLKRHVERTVRGEEARRRRPRRRS